MKDNYNSWLDESTGSNYVDYGEDGIIVEYTPFVDVLDDHH